MRECADAPPHSGTSVLLAGVSTRAAAESAARAGFAVTAIDAFGDLDQHASVRCISLSSGFTAHAAARAGQDMACDAVAYLASFENHPKAIGALAAGRSLWGNTPDVVRRVRNPVLLMETLREHGFATPDVRTRDDATSGLGRIDLEKRWLMKPLASGGGQRIRPWQPGAALPRGRYLQERIEGPAGSVVFVASGGRMVPLGVSSQLVGEEAFGALGFQYCGNILAGASADEALIGRACALAGAVAGAFQLIGLNGIDFVDRDGVPWAIEVNPRWCASMELVERAFGLSVFEAHAAACARATLPAFDLRQARRRADAVGKAVLYARRDTTVGDTRVWLSEPESLRDIPQPGERIPAGRPICTVFAAARSAAACREALVKRAARVYDQLAAWNREPTEIG